MTTTIKKSLSLALVVILMLALLIPVMPLDALAADDDTVAVTSTVVNLHYYRYDTSYSNWDAWLWSENADGSAFSFSTYQYTDGISMATATATFSGDATVYFIIRQGAESWTDREPGGDRVIDSTKYTLSDDGKTKTVDAYVLQDDSTVYYGVDIGDDLLDTDPKPSLVELQTKTVSGVSTKYIRVELFGTFSDINTFSLWQYEGDELVEIEGVTLERSSSSVINIYAPAGEEFALGVTYVVKWSEYDRQTTVSLDGDFYMTDEFNEIFAYDGELGAIWDSHQTVFKLWAPLADRIVLNIYSAGDHGTRLEQIEMTLGEYGVWHYRADGDYNGKYYTYSVYDTYHSNPNESVDPYARSVGVNGDRGMIIDLDSTDPEGWEDHSIPDTTPRDAVIYEAHVRDMTIDASSGVSEENRGKYLGLTETGTVNSYGQSTALDHLVDLGVNYLHLLPIYDYASVDEDNLDTAQFNWGYDPKNYNAPEGSYSSDPYNGEVRVNELKQTVMALHESGIKVVMDVVFNHTYSTGDSWFDQIFYSYYYRMYGTSYYNGSGCGNETASEREMMRKFMIDSVVYWATEYKIDGFRFDLMGLHDIETMNMIAAALREVNPDILIYGEGWTGGTSGLDTDDQALKANASELDGIAVFNDDTRDGIKGSVWEDDEPGYVNGAVGQESNVLLGTIGAIQGSRSLGLTGGYTNSPLQCINYVSAHDNLTLYDKLQSTNSTATTEQLIDMNKVAALLVLTGQGIPFMTNGEEIARTKTNEDGSFNDNSYNSSDYVNSIKWDTKNEYLELYNFYKALIQWRSDNIDLFFSTADEVISNVSILAMSDGYIAFAITTEDNYAEVHCNVSGTSRTVFIPEGDWTIDVAENTTGDAVGVSTVTPQTLNAYGMLIISKTDDAEGTVTGDEGGGLSTGAIIGISVGGAVVAGGGTTAGILIAKRRLAKAAAAIIK